MHSGRLRRDLQVHCRAGQCPTPEAPGVLPLLRRSVHLGRIRLLRRGPGGVTPITDTLSPRSARNTRHITRSSSTDRSICGRRIPPGKRRVATMHRKQSRFPWSPGGAARRDRLHAAAETAPAGRSRALTPRLNQAISSRHDFLHLRQKRGREIDDMKAHRRGYSTFSTTTRRLSSSILTVTSSPSSNGNLSSPATSAGTVTYRVFAFPTGTTRPFPSLAIYIVSYTVNYIYLCVVICNIQSKLQCR